MPAAGAGQAGAQGQQQSSGKGGHLHGAAHHAAQRNLSNAHKRKGSAASSTSSSSAGAATASSMAAAAANNATSSAAAAPAASTSSTSQASTTKDASTAASTVSTSSLSSMLGASIRLTLNTGSKDKERPVVTGQLWCYDPSYGSLVLSTPSTSGTGSNYRIVRLASIQNVTVTQAPKSASSGNDLALSSIDVGRIAEREAEGVRNEAKRIANEPPPGVSELGKALYEALSKTLPVRWANKSIVVMDEVLVEPPYSDQSVKSNNAQRKERVTKVISGETLKLQKSRSEILA